jgi:hypothetical protein
MLKGESIKGGGNGMSKEEVTPQTLVSGTPRYQRKFSHRKKNRHDQIQAATVKLARAIQFLAKPGEQEDRMKTHEQSTLDHLVELVQEITRQCTLGIIVPFLKRKC